MSTVLPPTGVPFVDNRSMVDYRWLRFLTQLQANSTPTGIGYVEDGSAVTYAPMTLFQGAQSSLPGTPVDGSLYFALDTGRIYFADSGSWELLSEELTGDVTKPVGSQVTSLANVFGSPGTYGAANLTPVLTIDAKGRVTGLSFEEIAGSSVVPGGSTTSLQFNDGGVFNGAQIFYDAANQSLIFSNPDPTFQNLSPLTTKGDILVHNGSDSVRQAIGTDGFILKANSALANGVEWVGPGTYDIPFQFNVINPFPLITIPANLVVKEVIVYLEVPFDGSGASLTIGDVGDNSALFPATGISVYEGAAWVSTPVLTYGVNTQVNLYIVPGTATIGSGIISLVIQT